MPDLSATISSLQWLSGNLAWVDQTGFYPPDFPCWPGGCRVGGESAYMEPWWDDWAPTLTSLMSGVTLEWQGPGTAKWAGSAPVPPGTWDNNDCSNCSGIDMKCPLWQWFTGGGTQPWPGCPAQDPPQNCMGCWGSVILTPTITCDPVTKVHSIRAVAECFIFCRDCNMTGGCGPFGHLVALGHYATFAPNCYGQAMYRPSLAGSAVPCRPTQLQLDTDAPTAELGRFGTRAAFCEAVADWMKGTYYAWDDTHGAPPAPNTDPCTDGVGYGMHVVIA